MHRSTFYTYTFTEKSHLIYGGGVKMEIIISEIFYCFKKSDVFFVLETQSSFKNGIFAFF